MDQPTRADDVVEQNTSQAVIAGVLAALCLILGIVFIAYGSLSLAGWVLVTIGLALTVFAAFRLIQNKQIPIEKLGCPYCQFQNTLTAKPEKDIMCRSCGRMIPIENGVILPTYHIKCKECGKDNFFSRRTIKLICEDCGKEVNLDNVRNMIQ
ncbi:MAG: hypothetical protein IT205_09005 [Fimbriimonadaceae bacterium]|nr:hypothetical protein [Fimbriimonadaceae bacterium]MCC7103422.1 hypothetical protein [Fimbriimonadaceae bacterium]